mgnify:CR=1 FL=1
MKRVEGGGLVQLLECTNPVRNKWRVRWDVQPGEQEGMVSYMEEEFSYKPSVDEVKALIVDWYNQQINNKIISGFAYNEVLVWLSQENQFNYKAAYDLALQTDGASLPVTFKFGTDEEPVYYEFDTLEKITDFYTKEIQFVQRTLATGWKKKDAVDLSNYE